MQQLNKSREFGANAVSEMELLALNGMFDLKDAPGVLRFAIEEIYQGKLALVSSFGADATVLLHMVSQIDGALPVLFLDTGKHFTQTIAFRDQIAKKFGLSDVRTVTPSDDDLAAFDPDGALWETDTDSCCNIRKTRPLAQAVTGFAAWITGRKRFQTQERGALPFFELTDDGMVKVNPLAHWTQDDVVAYKLAHNLPEHELVAQGYPSIGCAVCTTQVKQGEDPRSGRWRGREKEECGIHIDMPGQGDTAMGEPTQIFKDGRFSDDNWSRLGEDEGAEGAMFKHVPFSQFVAARDAFMATNGFLGLLVSPDDRVEDISQDVSRFASIAVEFPSFGDGRGYSTARLLRERYGFKGEIRAVGDVLIDQVPLMMRCGVDAFEVTHEATKKSLIAGELPDLSIYTQPVLARDEEHVGKRPWMRRAPEQNI